MYDTVLRWVSMRRTRGEYSMPFVCRPTYDFDKILLFVRKQGDSSIPHLSRLGVDLFRVACDTDEGVYDT